MSTPDQLQLLQTAQAHLPRVMSPLTHLHDSLNREHESLQEMIRQCPDPAEKAQLAVRLGNIWIAKHELTLGLKQLQRLADMKL